MKKLIYLAAVVLTTLTSCDGDSVNEEVLMSTEIESNCEVPIFLISETHTNGEKVCIPLGSEREIEVNTDKFKIENDGCLVIRRFINDDLTNIERYCPLMNDDDDSMGEIIVTLADGCMSVDSYKNGGLSLNDKICATDIERVSECNYGVVDTNPCDSSEPYILILENVNGEITRYKNAGMHVEELRDGAKQITGLLKNEFGQLIEATITMTRKTTEGTAIPSNCSNQFSNHLIYYETTTLSLEKILDWKVSLKSTTVKMQYGLGANINEKGEDVIGFYGVVDTFTFDGQGEVKYGRRLTENMISLLKDNGNYVRAEINVSLGCKNLR